MNRILGEWEISKIGSVPAPEDGAIVINFSNNKTLGGHTTSNSYGGSYSVSGSNLSVSGVYSTNALEAPYGNLFFQAIVNTENTPNDVAVLSINFPTRGKLRLTSRHGEILILQKH